MEKYNKAAKRTFKPKMDHQSGEYKASPFGRKRWRTSGK